MHVQNTGGTYTDINPRLFSFNAPQGACESCLGIGHLLKMIKGVKIKNLPEDFVNKILYGTGTEIIEFEYSNARGTRKFEQPFEGVIPILERRHNETKSEGARRFYEMYMRQMPCHVCEGKRLKKEVLNIFVGDKNIYELTTMSIENILKYLKELKLTETEKIISEEILKELNKRLTFLLDVGLRIFKFSKTGSEHYQDGEAQRIRLATQIGSGLTGVLYILDEPSIRTTPKR